MTTEEIGKLQYSLFDPTGNITALVESPVEIGRQPEAAAAIMALHQAVEQVGFVSFDFSRAARTPVSLRMAGGEFCGNASMSAAALFLLRKGEEPYPSARARTLRLLVSGTAQPVEVSLRRETETRFCTKIRMPGAREISERELVFSGVSGKLPLVCLGGISHLIVEEGSPFFFLREQKQNAERAVEDWCRLLGAEGLGLMFLEGEGARRRLTPLVFIPGSDTVFWENSCASGSAAVGMALSARSGAALRLELDQPGGALLSESDPQRGETWLSGRTERIVPA